MCFRSWCGRAGFGRRASCRCLVHDRRLGPPQRAGAVVALRVAAGDRLIGYKVGCTGPGTVQQFGMEGPIRGCLFESEVRNSRDALDLPNFASLAIEGEMAVRIGTDDTIEAVHQPHAIRFCRPSVRYAPRHSGSGSEVPSKGGPGGRRAGFRRRAPAAPLLWSSAAAWSSLRHLSDAPRANRPSLSPQPGRHFVLPRPRMGQMISMRSPRTPIISSCKCTVVSE